MMKCFGASPDGINDLGTMVEIKTPYRRRVDGNIPNGYMLQMQGQMAVCGLEECDFVDATIKMDYRSLDAYLMDIADSTDTAHATHLKVDHNNYKLYMLTPDCFKRLAMLSRSKNAEMVRTYFIEVEGLFLKYRTQTTEGMNDSFAFKT